MSQNNAASDAARALRAINSPAQQQAARENGKKGGRPKGQPMSDTHKEAIREARLRQEADRRAEGETP